MWFRRFEKRGIKIEWFSPENIEKINKRIKEAIDV